MIKKYDKKNIHTIIIGSGISALYYVYRNIDILKKETFKILEKNNYIGGRTKNEMFHNYSIVCGAGIGRYNKDKLLKKLLIVENKWMEILHNKKKMSLLML